MGSTPPSRPASPHEIRLPGFIDERIGLGDAIKRATSTMGIRPCGPCAERAARLNQRVVFSPWRRSRP
jgi:hypothetical protein